VEQVKNMSSQFISFIRPLVGEVVVKSEWEGGIPVGSVYKCGDKYMAKVRQNGRYLLQKKYNTIEEASSMKIQANKKECTNGKRPKLTSSQ